MNESINIKIFLKFTSAHQISGWYGNTWRCGGTLCHNCILASAPVCKPNMTDDEIKFLKENHPEFFI